MNGQRRLLNRLAPFLGTDCKRRDSITLPRASSDDVSPAAFTTATSWLRRPCFESSDGRVSSIPRALSRRCPRLSLLLPTCPTIRQQRPLARQRVCARPTRSCTQPSYTPGLLFQLIFSFLATQTLPRLIGTDSHRAAARHVAFH